jgi:hypothetical protein
MRIRRGLFCAAYGWSIFRICVDRINKVFLKARKCVWVESPDRHRWSCHRWDRTWILMNSRNLTSDSQSTGSPKMFWM